MARKNGDDDSKSVYSDGSSDVSDNDSDDDVEDPDNGQNQNNRRAPVNLPEITSDHWREEFIRIHPSMIPVFTPYDVSWDARDQLALVGYKPAINHNVTQNPICVEMMNNFLGGMYAIGKDHDRCLSSDKMHVAWGTFVSQCVKFRSSVLYMSGALPEICIDLGA